MRCHALDHLYEDGFVALGVLAENLYKGLDGTRTVHVHSDIDNAGPYVADELEQLGVRGHLEDLLAEVVPELVHHKVGEEGCNTLDQGSLEILGAIVLFELLLE